MPQGNTTIAEELRMEFLGEDPAWRSTGVLATFHLALHTGDPGAAGTQETHEATFHGYGRKPLARSDAVFSVVGTVVTVIVDVEFAEASGDLDNETITHVSLGTEASGASQIVYVGALQNDRPVVKGVQLVFPAGQLRFRKS